MAQTSDTKYRPGTVVRYTPDQSRHDPRWCREGMAIADKDGVLRDTYWGCGGDEHCVLDVEEASVEVLFHLDDFDELPRGRKDEWLSYSPHDAKRITSQHGLQERLFVRKGAAPSREMIVNRLRAKVGEAERMLRSQEMTLEHARQDLDAALNAPIACGCLPAMCRRGDCETCKDVPDWTKCPAFPSRLRSA